MLKPALYLAELLLLVTAINIQEANVKTKKYII